MVFRLWSTQRVVCGGSHVTGTPRASASNAAAVSGGQGEAGGSCSSTNARRRPRRRRTTMLSWTQCTRGCGTAAQRCSRWGGWDSRRREREVKRSCAAPSKRWRGLAASTADGLRQRCSCRHDAINEMHNFLRSLAVKGLVCAPPACRDDAAAGCRSSAPVVASALDAAEPLPPFAQVRSAVHRSQALL